ncbi:MAG: T9SS type A sorting domain-containing protein [Candidatus Zixiibacteriota bacterium]
MRSILAFLIIFLMPCLILASEFSIVYEQNIEGLESARYVDPIIDINGNYDGLIISNYEGYSIDIYDSLGILQHSITTEDHPIQSTNIYNESGDTLYIYALTFTIYHWWGEPYELLKIEVYNSGYQIITAMTPDFIHPSFPLGSFNNISEGVIDYNIWIEESLVNQVTNICFYVKQSFFWDLTAGSNTYQDVATFIRYNLDLSEEIVRTNYDYKIPAYLDNDTEVDEIVYLDYYYSTGYDYFNMMTDDYSFIRMSASQTGIYSRETDSSIADIKAAYVGNFIKDDSENEFITFGRVYDLLLAHEGISNHLACYSVNSDTIIEEWYTSIDEFTPVYYIDINNNLIGFGSGTKIMFFDASIGQFSDSVMLDINPQFERFYNSGDNPSPLLFGTTGNLARIYLLDPTTDVDQGIAINPERFELAQNHPNPFNPTTRIEYSLPRRSNVVISVFNILGQKVSTLVDENQSSGNHAVIWNGTDGNGEPIASGIYFYRMVAGEFTQSRKMMLIK